MTLSVPAVCQMQDGEGHSLSFLFIRLRGRPLQAPHRVTPGGDAAAKGPVQVEAAAAAGAVQRFAHKVKARTALELEVLIHLPQGQPASVLILLPPQLPAGMVRKVASTMGFPSSTLHRMNLLLMSGIHPL